MATATGSTTGAGKLGHTVTLRVRRSEFGLSIAAFVGVVVLGVLLGIAVAVALSIGNVFRRAAMSFRSRRQ